MSEQHYVEIMKILKQHSEDDRATFKKYDELLIQNGVLISNLHAGVTEVKDMLIAQNVIQIQTTKSIEDLKPLLIQYNKSAVLKEAVKNGGGWLIAIFSGIAILYTGWSIIIEIIRKIK